MRLEGDKRSKPIRINSEIKRVQKVLEYKIRTTKIQLELGKRWLDDSKKSLGSARALRSIDKFNSLYIWCHGIEQMIKGYGLIMGAVTEDELKKPVGHKTPRISFQLLDKVSKDIPIAEVANETYNLHFKEVKQIINTNKDNYQMYVRRLTGEELNELLIFCEKSDEELKASITAEGVYDDYRENPNKFRITRDLFRVINQLPKKDIIKLIEIALEKVKISPFLLHPRITILGLISSSYLDIAKYPTENEDILNEESPIVILLERLDIISQEQIKRIEEMSKVIGIEE